MRLPRLMAQLLPSGPEPEHDKKPGQLMHWLLLAISLILASPAWADAAVTTPDAEYSRKGADSCLKCHDDAATSGIFHGPHGGRSSANLPFAEQQCESCHGPSASHAKRYRDETQRPAPFAFARGSQASASSQNQRCLSCHQRGARLDWDDSAHGEGELLCSSCHSLHDSTANARQSNQLCGSCHADVSAQTLQFSSHPLRQGQMNCSDCHQVHGQVMGDHLLQRMDARETCLSCHAEKRGPFLWEHAPAAEDCGQCHNAHGSNHPALLKTVKPMLCQSCHSQTGHPSQPFTPEGLVNGQPSAFLLLNSCSNCHSQAHGSNHPSGANLLR